MPNRSYAIRGDAGWDMAPFVGFSTGMGADDSSPDEVKIGNVDGGYWPGSDSSCRPTLYLIPRLGPVAADVFHEVELGWDADFDDSVVVTGVEPSLGWGVCTTTVPDLKRGDRVWLRARALDVSGNSTRWSEAEEARVTRASGCASVPESNLPGWLILLSVFLPRQRVKPG